MYTNWLIAKLLRRERERVLGCQSEEARPWNKCFLCPAATVGLRTVPSQRAVRVDSCRLQQCGLVRVYLAVSWVLSSAGLNSWVRLSQLCVQQLCPPAWQSCRYINLHSMSCYTSHMWNKCYVRGCMILGSMDVTVCVCVYACVEVRKSMRNVIF